MACTFACWLTPSRLSPSPSLSLLTTPHPCLIGRGVDRHHHRTTHPSLFFHPPALSASTTTSLACLRAVCPCPIPFSLFRSALRTLPRICRCRHSTPCPLLFLFLLFCLPTLRL
ncbi:hypothetical protein COCSADRAFT_237876 [Bipolaris sorokiniana ND90Pr]|uniref:Uncharacterized protein n=1 Tax=Cochliobolus sativus (strain ND90Pr / ATCC 201652) TaxID=665912 RepID=M2SET1_COCSN|nr:uncharacterized protein COCSADRAFT_237876 [Bipolaris sorokiniana ND90Pr]EMD60970.1 hypothetical protein COCSADRAFT_237876 [Bipolaris sorokiniana ND90Pr]